MKAMTSISGSNALCETYNPDAAEARNYPVLRNRTHRLSLNREHDDVITIRTNRVPLVLQVLKRSKLQGANPLAAIIMNKMYHGCESQDATGSVMKIMSLAYKTESSIPKDCIEIEIKY